MTNIVNNFGKFHSDLQNLKKAYLQEKSQMNSLIQLSSSLNGQKKSDNDLQINKLKESISGKKQKVQEAAEGFSKLHNELRTA